MVVTDLTISKARSLQAYLFACETAMRCVEIAPLKWNNVILEERWAHPAEGGLPVQLCSFWVFTDRFLLLLLSETLLFRDLVRSKLRVKSPQIHRNPSLKLGSINLAVRKRCGEQRISQLIKPALRLEIPAHLSVLRKQRAYCLFQFFCADAILL